MDSSVYECKKQISKVQNEVPFPELLCSSNYLKAKARGKNPEKSAKDLHEHSNLL